MLELVKKVKKGYRLSVEYTIGANNEPLSAEMTALIQHPDTKTVDTDFYSKLDISATSKRTGLTHYFVSGSRQYWDIFDKKRLSEFFENLIAKQ